MAYFARWQPARQVSGQISLSASQGYSIERRRGVGVLGTYGGSALKYWGAILASAVQGKPVADMWDAIRTSQEAYGFDRPGTSAPDVMVLRGYANRLVNSSGALAAAAEGDTITAAMMAIAPYTDQTPESIATMPTYQVRYVNEVQLEDGSVTSVWQTSVFSAQDMPSTVRDLNATLEFNAQQLAASGAAGSENTPKGTSLGISDTQILVV